MRGLTARFLETVAEAIEALGFESPSRSFHPSLGVFSAGALASIASFSRGVFSPLVILAASVALVVALRVRLRAWARPVALVFFLVSVISIPLPFITPGAPVATVKLGQLELIATAEGLEQAASFILRATAASAAFTAILLHVGWRGLVEGLRGLRLPWEFAFLLGLLIRYIPAFLRDALSMAAAREARLLTPSSRPPIGAFASVVGELMLRGHERAWRLEKAMRARMFGSLRGEERSWSVGAGDLALVGLTAILTAVCIALEVL